MCESAWYSSSEMRVTHTAVGSDCMLFTFSSETRLNIYTRTKRPILRRAHTHPVYYYQGPKLKMNVPRTHGTWGILLHRF